MYNARFFSDVFCYVGVGLFFMTVMSDFGKCDG